MLQVANSATDEEVVHTPRKYILAIILNVSRFNFMLYIVYIISFDTVRYGEDSSSIKSTLTMARRASRRYLLSQNHRFGQQNNK